MGVLSQERSGVVEYELSSIIRRDAIAPGEIYSWREEFIAAHVTLHSRVSAPGDFFFSQERSGIVESESSSIIRRDAVAPGEVFLWREEFIAAYVTFQRLYSSFEKSRTCQSVM